MGMIAASLRIPAALLVTLGASALAAEVEGPDVTVDAVLVEPSNPGPSTLCRLKVRLKNSGNQVASFWAFEVTIAGEKVSTYKAQTFGVNVEPGDTDEIELPGSRSMSERTVLPA